MQENCMKSKHNCNFCKWLQNVEHIPMSFWNFSKFPQI